MTIVRQRHRCEGSWPIRGPSGPGHPEGRGLWGEKGWGGPGCVYVNACAWLGVLCFFFGGGGAGGQAKQTCQLRQACWKPGYRGPVCLILHTRIGIQVAAGGVCFGVHHVPSVNLPHHLPTGCYAVSTKALSGYIFNSASRYAVTNAAVSSWLGGGLQWLRHRVLAVSPCPACMQAMVLVFAFIPSSSALPVLG